LTIDNDQLTIINEMNSVTVAVYGRSPIDTAALSALLVSLPGLAVVPTAAGRSFWPLVAR